MRNIHCSILSIVICFFSFQICMAIYFPIQEVPRPAYTTGIKTTYKKPLNPSTLQNYSKVVVHNRPDSPGVQYVATQAQEVQNVYPVYNAHSYGQRPAQIHENILQTQAHTEINAGLLGFSTTNPNRTIIKRRIETKTLEIFNKCPPGETGQFIYSLSCNQFLNCWKGRGTVQNCAPGTLFNPKTLECDFPDKVECVSGPRSNTIQNLRVEKSVKQASCPEGFSGIIPDYFDCSKFINCDNGQPNKMDCAPGTLFDMNKNMCDYPHQTTCFNGENIIDVRTQPHKNKHGQNNCQDNNCKQDTQYTNQQSGQSLYDTGYKGREQNIHSHTYCNPQTQNCRPTHGLSTNYGQSVTHTQGTTYGQDTANYGQSGTNLGTGQTTFYPHTVQHPCNQDTQDCGQTTGFDQSSNNLGQGSYGQSQTVTYNYGCDPATLNCQPTQNVDHKCNPLIHDCSNQNSLNSNNLAIGQTTIHNHAVSQDCNPQTQNCGQSNNQKPNGQTVIYTQTITQRCNPRTQNCGPNTGQQSNSYGQTTIEEENTGQQTDDSYDSNVGLRKTNCDPSANRNCKGYTTTEQKPNNGHQDEYLGNGHGELNRHNCNPALHDCNSYIRNQNSGQQNEYLGNAHGELNRHNCNPATHDCDSYVRNQNSGQSNSYGQNELRRHNCNPAVQNCDQYVGQSTSTTYTHTLGSSGQDHGQTVDTTYTQTNNLGNGDSSQFIGNCNPFLQKCNLATGQNGYHQTNIPQSGGTFICNLSEPNCGHGQKNPVTEHTQVQPNYGKICNVNDKNCGKNQWTGTTTVTKQVTNSEPVCADGAVGMHKHPTDCKKYLTCGSGQTFVMDCAPGTLFNTKTGMCDFPYNVKCEISEPNANTGSYDNGWQNQYEKNVIDGGETGGHGHIKTTTEPTSHTWGQHSNNNWDQHANSNWGPSSNSNWGQRTDNKGQLTDNKGQYTNSWGQQTENNRGQQTEDNRGQHIEGQQTEDNWGQQTEDNWGQKPDTTNTVTESNRGQSGYVSRPTQRSNDYDDIYNPNNHKDIATTARSAWPPPYQVEEDINKVDYVFTYDDGTPVTLEPDNIITAEERKTKHCEDIDFRCTPKLCISLTMVCDGNRDCDDGKDELNCQEYTQRFSVAKNHQLVVVENQRWINVTHSTCALLCIQNTKFTCRSFTYRRPDRTCFLSDKNIGLTGSLQSHQSSDYYELKDGTIDCSDKSKYFECSNKKCLTKEYLCDGYDDCGDREDEKHCNPEKFGYKIKLAGSPEKHEGRVQVTAFGSTGYICDDEFGIADANVICKELGFELGAAEVKGQSQFAKDLKESNTLYMIDDLSCRGNETTLIDCSFPGWGIHNCKDQEIAGVVCKTPQEKCSNDSWKCDTGNECIPYDFVCDGVEDCTDSSDEGSQHCEAPTELRLIGGSRPGEGRIEIKHNGIWGTICDDDFNEDAGKVVCKYLGYKGSVSVKKEGYFGAGFGPIWLDQVSCFGNETELHKCTHWNWGEHNCEHSEDVGVICSNDLDEVKIERHSNFPTKIEAGLPTNCGFRKDNQFVIHDLIHARVIGGGVAKKGDYPWQAALKVRVKDKSAHWCGAVIISSKWVLTAAHCLQGYTKGAYIIVAGEYNTDENEGTEQQKYIDEFFIHEKFRKGHKLNNDIALIKVKGAGFELNDDIQPICLPDADTDYAKDLNCTISGFGSIKSGVSAYSHDLLAAWIPINSQDICKMPHVYGDVLTDNMLCAGSMDGGLDACDGDSGGPLACLNQGVFTLYGITSWGQHCGYANKPGVYVKVGNYRQWIEETISKHSQ